MSEPQQFMKVEVFFPVDLSEKVLTFIAKHGGYMMQSGPWFRDADGDFIPLYTKVENDP